MKTVEIPSPTIDNLEMFVTYTNANIRKGFCVLIFEYEHNEYFVKRIAKIDDQVLLVIFDDYAKNERRVPILAEYKRFGYSFKRGK